MKKIVGQLFFRKVKIILRSTTLNEENYLENEQNQKPINYFNFFQMYNKTKKEKKKEQQQQQHQKRGKIRKAKANVDIANNN